MTNTTETSDSQLTHGVAVGDVRATSAVVWARLSEAGMLHVEYDTDPEFAAPTFGPPIYVDATTDYTGHLRLSGLEPSTAYHYRIWGVTGVSDEQALRTAAVAGRFRTAPYRDVDEAVSFVWSGDMWGQGNAPPYGVLAEIEAVDPDFFLFLGDIVYADDPTPAVPEGASTLDEFRAKYREAREESANLRSLLEATSVYVTWDDHEVVNNFAGPTEELTPLGLQAFREYWPIDAHPVVTGLDEDRIFRSFRWGQHLELFVLDTRQYRDDNSTADSPDKTMLGATQRAWLKESLRSSDAMFKIIVSGVALSSISGPPEARDSWPNGGGPTGFEYELLGIVNFLGDEVGRNVVWLAADRHFARVLSYDPRDEGQHAFHEAIAGPVGAATRDPTESPPDQTLNPSILYEEGGEYEHGDFRNFGEVTADGSELRLRIVDKRGEERFVTTIPNVDYPERILTDRRSRVVDRLIDTNVLRRGRSKRRGRDSQMRDILPGRRGRAKKDAEDGDDAGGDGSSAE
jgi:alkaline phosphatase D